MRAFKRAAAFILVLAMLLSSADFMQIVEAATEGDNLKVENQFISYLIDKKTGRYGISTVEGAPGRDGDRMAPLLYKGEKPDTSFTTFRIDGEDYIFGNDYGFLGIQGGITKSPATQGGINTTVWRAGDVEIRQQLTIVSDSANPDVGNVKVAYTVVNTGKTGKSIGSRILFDTMLGENDGSPLIIPGIKEPIEYEAGFEGDKVPAFWQSADRDICPNVVSYGLISGWNNKAPDRMTAAHWNGIGATKWDYIPDSTVKFASVFNKYNKSDSAVALYWDPEFLEAGETRVYETFYGLGLFLSADGSTFLAAMSGPDKLEMKEDRTGYVQEDFEIALSIDNSLPTSVQMKNMNAVIELEGGLKLSPGQPKEIMLGTVERDSRAELTWKVQGELSQFFRIGQATIFLKSESLKETLTYSKYTILPGGTDKLPDIQYTEITPKNLYYQDTRKSFEINGTGFGMLKDRSRWELKLVKGGTNPTVYTINHKMINIIDDKKIQVILQDINDIGSYTVKLSHRDFQGCTFENGLNITDDTAYKNLKYGILAVTGEQGSSYKINVFEDEDSLKKFKGNDKILLVIRGDIQQKENQSYEAYPGSSDFVEMNGVLLYKSDVPVKISESNGSVKLIGSGDLSVSGSVTFWKWDFKIDFDKGTKYTLKLSDESDNLDNNKKIEIVFTGVGGALKNMLSGFNLKFNNAYFYKDDQGNGLIFGGSLYLSLGSKKDEGDSNNNNNNNNNDNIISNKDKKDDSKDPFKIEIDVQKVAMGQKSDDSIGFKGIAAEATVGFPKGYFPPPVDIGAEANVKIDTLSDPGEFGIKLDIDLKVIKVKGEIEFVLIPYPIPDKLYFYMGSDVGVDIIPPIPVATLLGVGGGIDNIYNLVNMDASSPPFTVMLTASAEIAKILKMEDVTLSVSWQHAELKGDIGIKGYNIIKDAVIRIRWYTPFGFHASARLEAFDCIEGKVLLNIFKDDILGIASVRLFVPKKVPTVGGMTIAGAELGVDMKKLWAELTVIGITMGVKYVYGESIPDFYIGDGVQGTGELVAYMDGTKGLCTMNYKNEETGEEGVMIYGTNISLLGSSEKGKAYAKDRRYLAAASTDKRFMLMDMPAVMALNDSTYQLNVQNQEAALFEIEYEGAKPHVRVFRPDGSEYILIEDDIRGNMRYQTIGAGDSDSGRDEQKLWISAVNPQPGIWKIISDKPLKLARLYDVKMASEFTSLNSIKIDNSNIKIEWTGKYLDDAKINLFLLEEGSNEAGRLLESGIDATMGSYTAALPEDVQTGRYVIRAELTKEDYGFTSKTTNAFDVTDLKAPDQPRNLKVVSAGNGCLKAEWDKGQDGKYPAQGYIITVFNEDGTNIPEFPEAYVSDRTETIIGGEVTQQDGTTVRIEPGKSYKVSVMAHREDELVPGEEIKKQHYSEPLMSDAVYLPVPQPPELKLLLKQGEDILPLNTGESNIDEYYSKGNEAVLSLEGD
ncbi:MAG TPA: fibronectin type III domain-containing protein, partial [Bacillota bacterium]|nr:fibronectin type III domain-containing protein [Bacillota bacterium]